MTLRGEKGKAASTVPVFAAGVNPQETAGNWWPGEQAWDVETGLGSWRPVGPNKHSGVAAAKVSRHESGGICIVPNPGATPFHWSTAASCSPRLPPRCTRDCGSIWTRPEGAGN